ncbi:MAG: ABC transporter permease [Candidatus Hadarchaeum sp.]|uniref:ABC transporter permease n=1 Tax=Candidatus Hadarchaeum sp. TaxID=2883567 RepID=UPI0031829BF6
MSRFVIFRISSLLFTLFVAVSVVFFAMRLAPGDPAQLLAGQQTQEDVKRVREFLGLNMPIHVQYIRFLTGVIRGDLGVSALTKGSVSKEILRTMPATFVLLTMSMLLTTGIGVPAGVICALASGSIYDLLIMLLVVGALSVPNFWLGILMIDLFSVRLGWLPTSGFWGIKSTIMPALAIAARQIAIVTRMTRVSMLEVLGEDYIKVACAKGLPNGAIVIKHGLRNALLPVVTTLGLQTGFLLGGSIVIEVLFAWPGIGQLLINAITTRDYNLIQGITVFYVGGFLLTTFFMDLCYAWLDPRIRYG